jgi:hypothetical protein
MEVRLLVVPECPNETPTAQVLRRALDQVGLADVGFSTVVVRDDEQAARLGFAGSPTVMIDGVDPLAESGASPALACRVFRTAEGLSGTPDLAELRRALKVAAVHRADNDSAR